MWFSQLKTKLSAACLFAAVSSFLNVSPTFAQADNHPFNCGADHIWEAKAKQNPAMYSQREQLLNKVMQIENTRSKDGQEDVKIIPVVFHIIHQYGSENISRQRVLDQLATLNETFAGKNKDTSNIRPEYKYLIANSGIEFRLATKDPNGNCTDGIVRVYSAQTNGADDNVKRVSYWNSNNYLNVWVVSNIANFGQPGTILGYAQFPWDNSATTDGIVMRADQVVTGNKTLTHEIGHYLGLLHTFQSGCGSSCSSSGDHICDTPPSSEPTRGCPSPTYNSCSNDNPNLPDMYENFMDYSSCSRMFTTGQKARMDAVFSSTKRANLITLQNQDATGVSNTSSVLCTPVADFYATQYVICEGASISFKDNTYNALPSSYEWSFTGGNPSLSTVKDPIIKFEKAGIYEVKLQVTNAAGSNTLLRTALITVLPAMSNIKSPLTETFENFDPITKGYEFSTDNRGLKWNLTTKAAATGSTSLYLNNLNAQEEETYYFTLPAIDLTTSATKKLAFNLAYAQVLTNTNDEFRVQVSSNCGQNFNTVMYKFGSKLATTTALKTNDFVPEENEWRAEEVDLTTYKNTKNLMIRFVLKNRNGNNMYVDNINIGGIATSINEPKHFSGNAYMEIYPNPTASDFSLRTGSFENNASLEVFDASGKQLTMLSGINISSDEPLQLNKTMLNIHAGGVYYIKLHTANASYVQKLIISQ
ncbi:MAG: M43 family zinc metalloprotease [Bacteroidia bacterium]